MSKVVKFREYRNYEDDYGHEQNKKVHKKQKRKMKYYDEYESRETSHRNNKPQKYRNY